MPNIKSIRDGIASLVDNIAVLNVYSALADSVMVPAAYVGQPEIVEYDYTFRVGNFRCQIPVKVVAGAVQEDEAQHLLDSFVSYDGANSFPAVINTDPTLNGSAQTCRVIQARNYGVYEIGGVSYLGVEFLLEVIA